MQIWNFESAISNTKTVINFDVRYVHNNIFFSFAVDSDLNHLSRKRASDIISINSSGKASHNFTSADGGISYGENAGESNGVVELAQVSSESQLAESEQATYASANNDLKGTKAYQEADVPGLYNLAMAIIDYRGHRVVAQVCLKDVISLNFLLGVFLKVYPVNLID